MLRYLERHNILGYFAAATKYPSVKISCDTGLTFARSAFTGRGREGKGGGRSRSNVSHGCERRRRSVLSRRHAKEIVRFYEETGGLITEKDLANFQVEWQEPISTIFKK